MFRSWRGRLEGRLDAQSRAVLTLLLPFDITLRRRVRPWAILSSMADLLATVLDNNGGLCCAQRHAADVAISSTTQRTSPLLHTHPLLKTRTNYKVSRTHSTLLNLKTPPTEIRSTRTSSGQKLACFLCGIDEAHTTAIQVRIANSSSPLSLVDYR